MPRCETEWPQLKEEFPPKGNRFYTRADVIFLQEENQEGFVVTVLVTKFEFPTWEHDRTFGPNEPVPKGSTGPKGKPNVGMKFTDLCTHRKYIVRRAVPWCQTRGWTVFANDQ